MPGPGGPPTLALTLSRSARDTPRLFPTMSTVLPPPRPSPLMTSASSASMTL
ncbi:hypothetical protein EXIGLDRAFT_720710 [Exidia glandulosa HHB12029]|uniref:Uncharacterized protein n=1 Tax=Exidia glandulosa HHB12029 TaxID=1314781 RepID=A0A165G6F6_EXIGL|nr:hypothetical protein EXIGLDRAFT_720710 [Exidia glandulosa HHB12029]